MEYSKFPKKFMDELYNLLVINKTDKLCISGIKFDYIIAQKQGQFLKLKKTNIESKYVLKYDLHDDKITKFIIEDSNNKFSNEDYEGGLCFIKEFYNLFVHKESSKILNNVLNQFNFYQTNRLTFNSKEPDIFYTVSHPGEKTLVILKQSHDGSIISKVAYQQIDGTINWFTISKSEKYTCIKKIRKFLTLEKSQLTQEDKLINYIYPQKIQNIYGYDPYLNQEQKTKAEKLIYDYYDNHSSRITLLDSEKCPNCGKLMIVDKKGKKEIYKCIDFPICKGEL